MKFDEAPLLIWVMFAAAAILLVLIQLLWSRLRVESDGLFRKIGEPHVLMNNTPGHLVPFWRWLYAPGSVRTLSAPTRFLAWVIRLATPVYAVGVVVIAITQF
jgi:hypothetical protein